MPIAANIYYHAHQLNENLPVVLLHGAGGSHLSWPSEVRRMSGFRVYALDLPGHGKSAGRGYQSIPSYAGAVLEWLDAMSMHSAVFIGHSMGGAIAQLLALDHARQVLALVLIGCASRLRVNPILIEEAAQESRFHHTIEKVVAWSFSPQTPENLKALVAKRLADTRHSVLHGDLLACDAFDVTDRISEITQPTLVMCGSEDKMTTVRNSYFLADNLPTAQLEIVPGAGHMLMLEKPLEVARLLTRFLSAIPY